MVIKLPDLEEMLEAGMHFGHRSFRWHPQMAPFIFGEREGVHIINLELTQVYLKSALEFVEKIVSEGGKILLVGTKKQVAPLVQKAAEETAMPYVVSRWPGGLLTNFRTVLKSLKRVGRLDELLSNPYATKKEKRFWEKQKQNLEANFAGIASLTELPGAIFIVDLVKEKVALKEARKLKIPVVALVDTNANPTLADYPIPANDDASSSVSLVTSLITQAIKESQKKLSAITKRKEMAEEKIKTGNETLSPETVLETQVEKKRDESELKGKRLRAAKS